jgi:ribosome-binding protein aMBF1 (putative translation factor)
MKTENRIPEKELRRLEQEVLADTAARVRKEMAYVGASADDLAEMLDVTPQAIRVSLNRGVASVKSLTRLARTLGLRPVVTFRPLPDSKKFKPRPPQTPSSRKTK